MKDIHAKIDGLLSVTKDLSEVLTQENDLLRARRLHSIEDLQSRKAALVRSYEGLLRELTKDPEILAPLEPGRRAELREKMTRFEALVQENANQIKAAKEINERLLREIAGAAMKGQSERGIYSKKGDLIPACHGQAISMAVDQTS